MEDRIVLNITPQPYVWVTPQMIAMFRIPERCYYIPTLERRRRYDRKTKQWEEIVDEPTEGKIWIGDLGCELYNNTGYCKHTSSKYTRDKKRRANEYLKYRNKIKKLCAEAGFELQVSGVAIYYYHPIPTRWSKKKKLIMRGQLKLTKPDWDNMTKAIQDALGKKRGEISDRMPDERVAHLAGTGKYWCYDLEAKEGYIEILVNQPVYNPFNVMFINQLV